MNCCYMKAPLKTEPEKEWLKEILPLVRVKSNILGYPLHMEGEVA